MEITMYRDRSPQKACSGGRSGVSCTGHYARFLDASKDVFRLAVVKHILKDLGGCKGKYGPRSCKPKSSA